MHTISSILAPPCSVTPPLRPIMPQYAAHLARLRHHQAVSRGTTHDHLNVTKQHLPSLYGGATVHYLERNCLNPKKVPPSLQKPQRFGLTELAGVIGGQIRHPRHLFPPLKESKGSSSQQTDLRAGVSKNTMRCNKFFLSKCCHVNILQGGKS